MSSYDPLSVCRLCLTKAQQIREIFADVGEDDVSTDTKIHTWLPIKVLREDKFSHIICESCFFVVDQAYNLWKTCLNADKQLREWQSSVNTHRYTTVTTMLDQDIMKGEQSNENRLDGSVMSGHQNSMNMDMDNMQMMSIMMPNNNQQQLTSVPIDTSGGSIQNIQVIAGSSTQPHEIISSQTNVPTQQEEEEDESTDDSEDEGDEGDEGLPIKEESEEDPNNSRTIEPTTFVNVSLHCDEAGPSGIRQQKISDIQELAQAADIDPKTGDPLVDPLYIPDSKSVNDQSMDSPSVPDTNNLECSSVENSVDSSLYKSKLRRRRKTTLASRKESHCHAMQDSRRHSRRQNVKQKKINEKMKSYSKCGTCGKCFSWDAMVKHLNEPKYSCQNCRQVFCVEVQLNRHVATVHGEPIYSCSICEYKSKNKRTLTDHFIRKHTEEDQFSCKKQLAIQDGQEQQANRVRSGKSSITCSICGHVSKNVRAIKAHMKYRHYKPQFVCEICRRGLTTQKNLEQHLEWHETRENKECPTCHKKCRVRDLKQHMQTHSDAKLFSCPVCDKTFREQYYREQHMLLHTGKKPYMCSICNLTFTQKRRLIAHRKTHPGPLPPLPVVPVEKIIAEFMKKYTKKNTINKNNTK